MKCFGQHIVDAEEEVAKPSRRPFTPLLLTIIKIKTLPSKEDPSKGSPTGALITTHNPNNLLKAYYNSAFLAHTSDFTTFHTLTKQTARPMHYNKEKFYGILVNTGANKLSTAGKRQYKAYCAAFGNRPVFRPSNFSCTFGMGTAQSLSAADILFPLGGIILKATFYIVNANIPFLLCLADMVRLSIFYNNTRDRLIYYRSNEFAPIQRIFGHLFIS